MSRKIALLSLLAMHFTKGADSSRKATYPNPPVKPFGDAATNMASFKACYGFGPPTDLERTIDQHYFVCPADGQNLFKNGSATTELLMSCRLVNLNNPKNATAGFSDDHWCVSNVYCMSPDQTKKLTWFMAAHCNNNGAQLLVGAASGFKLAFKETSAYAGKSFQENDYWYYNATPGSVRMAKQMHGFWYK